MKNMTKIRSWTNHLQIKKKSFATTIPQAAASLLRFPLLRRLISIIFCLPLLRDSAALPRSFSRLLLLRLSSTALLRNTSRSRALLCITGRTLLRITSLILLLAAISFGLLLTRRRFLLVLLLVIWRRALGLFIGFLFLRLLPGR